jgi:hypothetical protein
MDHEKNALSDNDIDNRLKEALRVLGKEPRETSEGDAAISAAREFLLILSIALIKADVEKKNREDSSFWPSLEE